MYQVRLISVRFARSMEWIYSKLEAVIVALDPVFRRIGYRRIEPAMVVIEKLTKGFLFDCQMCGQCVLSSTGMSCPMNCPKRLRNGPCGGVRPSGCCEVNPDMKCVWVQAVHGAARMRNGAQMNEILPPVDYSLQGSSAWLRVSREKAMKRVKADKT